MLKMRRHKQYISEWKGVSNNLKRLATEIVNIIWKMSSSQPPKLDARLLKPCIQGTFVYDLHKISHNPEDDFGFDNLTVNYLLYLFDSNLEYSYSYDKMGSSYSDSETNTINVISGLVEGNANHQTVEEIWHELEHLFQYGMGMEKREELYDNVIKNAKSEENKTDSLVARLVYFTFPHEQDAFVNQFYAMLDTQNFNSTFQIALYSFEAYRNFSRLFGEFKEKLSNDTEKEEIIRSSNKINLSIRQLKNRIHFGFKRFKNKLKMVYERHNEEMKQKKEGVEESLRRSRIISSALNEYKDRYGLMEIINE